jgi:DNA polymerase
MNNTSEMLLSFLRQQKQLNMPDLILEKPFDPFVLQHTAVTRPSQAEKPRKYSTRSTPPQNSEPATPSSRLHSRLAHLTKIDPSSTPRSRETAQKGAQYTEKREKLKELYHSNRTCKRCALGEHRNSFIFGAGNADAPIMIIGEAPGAEEDRKGLPFVGRAGQLLTKMLTAISVDRKKDTFITNILKCRPPQNRNPYEEEIMQCLPLLRKQIEIIRPNLIILLGRIAAKTILETTGSIASLRRSIHTYRGVTTVVTYHPAALLRNEALKDDAWDDMKNIRQILTGMNFYNEKR